MSSVIKPSSNQSRDRKDSDGGFAEGLLHSTESSRWDLDKDTEERIQRLEPVPKIVSEPDHYVAAANGYPLIDVLEAWSRGGASWAQLNIMKYVFRFRRKNGLEDLLKAQKYLELLIENERNRD